VNKSALNVKKEEKVVKQTNDNRKTITKKESSPAKSIVEVKGI
jgi:hypothetical protein